MTEVENKLLSLKAGFAQTFGVALAEEDLHVVVCSELQRRQQEYLVNALGSSWRPNSLIDLRLELERRSVDVQQQAGSGDSGVSGGEASEVLTDVREVPRKGGRGVRKRKG